MIQIIAFGKVKNTVYFEAQQEFLKRLSGKVQLVELEAAKGSEAEMLAKEEKILQAYLSQNAFNILLDSEGREFDSVQFSQKLQKFREAHNNINFFIGSSHGFSNQVKQQADYKLSLGKFTMPHLLARVVLLEQVFRAFSIYENHPYHK